jgi:hypothetical protein
MRLRNIYLESTLDKSFNVINVAILTPTYLPSLWIKYKISTEQKIHRRFAINLHATNILLILYTPSPL